MHLPFSLLLRGPRPLRQRVARDWARALPGPLVWVTVGAPPALRADDAVCFRRAHDCASLRRTLQHASTAGTVVLDDLDDALPQWWDPRLRALRQSIGAPLLCLADPPPLGERAPAGLDLVADLDDDDVLIVRQAADPGLQGLVVRDPGAAIPHRLLRPLRAA